MIYKLITFVLCCAGILIASSAFSQLQSCPVNINFASRDLSLWSAKTGLVTGASQNYPAPNAGRAIIPEYSITTTGVKVITTPSNDLYGSFTTIPTINGYAYGYSLQIGSTATSWDLHTTTSNPGGFIRSVAYTINVPAGPVTVPYTMTYAYAMVLENGTHNSNEQPMFRAILNTQDSIITCASPKYFLPTHDDAGGGAGSTGATLDTAAALASGFINSPVLFLSHAGTVGNNGTLLRDVWTKGWTEVTFDLSAYRGQQVTLTFESDNCAPGAHFAYAYVAVRNSCAGLEISGNNVACTNSTSTYSVPALAGANYQWTVPPTWTINSGGNTNIINVTAGNAGGIITIHEVNGCADLRDTIDVTTTLPTVAGQVINDNEVCTGINSTQLTLNGQTGNVLNWISSTNGTTWTPIPITTTSYTAQNLTATTRYRALVQNGSACNIDTSEEATIIVDPQSVGGILTPANTDICAGQNANNILTLSGNTGSVLNWQISHDNTNWNNFSPANTNSTYAISTINSNTQYRVIVRNGVCPADTSDEAIINFINVPFPSAAITPADSICYGKSTLLNATINIGTSYTWSNANTLTNQGNGTISSLPHVINATAKPLTTTDYVLTINNAGCPNALRDTFHVKVSPKVTVFAGNDTAVVGNQPLQLNAIVSDPAANIFNWTPGTGLNFTNIYNPVAILNTAMGESITYIVRATNPQGCYGEDDIKVTIFKTGPEIFVPSAFTPNGNGLNDIIVPICVGIERINFFRIYNRWGQMVFSTSEIGRGWNGMIQGIQQASGNFVYMVQGIDYLGNKIFKKGNVVLIR